MPAAIGAALLAGLPGLTGLGTAAAITVAGIPLTTIVGTAVLVGGSYAYQASQRPNRPEPPKPSDGQVTTRQPLQARRKNYGRVKVGGALIFRGASGGVLYQVYAVNQGEIDAFEEHWIGDIRVSVNGEGVVTPVEVGNEAFLKDGSPYVRLFMEMGTDTDLGFQILNETFPEWDVDCRAKGVAKILLMTTQPKAEDFTSIYPMGTNITYRAVIRASKVWDPRDLTQDRYIKSSWKWSENPVLQALDYHRHRDGMGLMTTSSDATLFSTVAINADWIPAANCCDQGIPLKDGFSEPRYRSSGGYYLPTPPKTVLEPILATCDGQIFMRTDGALGMRVGGQEVELLGVNDNHITSYSGFRSGDDLFLTTNQVTAKYTSPDHDYQDTDATPWRDEADVTARGQELTSAIDLGWVSSYSQARRLMKIEMFKRNAAWQGSVITDLSSIVGFGRRDVALTIDELLIDGDIFRASAFTIDTGSVTCSLSVSALPAEAYEWDEVAEEGDPPPIPPDISNSYGVEPPDDFDAFLVAREISAGTNGVVIGMMFDPGDRTDVTADAQYKKAADSSWLDGVVSTSYDSAETPLLTDGETYSARVRLRVGSKTSDWVQEDGIVARVPPSPATGLIVSNAAGSAKLDWTNPSSPNLTRARVFRGTTAVFNSASDQGTTAQTPSTPGTRTLSPGAGTWYFWVVAESANGAAAAPVGPQSITL